MVSDIVCHTTGPTARNTANDTATYPASYTVSNTAVYTVAYTAKHKLPKTTEKFGLKPRTLSFYGNVQNGVVVLLLLKKQSCSSSRDTCYLEKSKLGSVTVKSSTN